MRWGAQATPTSARWVGAPAAPVDWLAIIQLCVLSDAVAVKLAAALMPGTLHGLILQAAPPLRQSQEEIKRAFRRAALRWHPDKQVGAGEGVPACMQVSSSLPQLGILAAARKPAPGELQPHLDARQLSFFCLPLLLSLIGAGGGG